MLIFIKHYHCLYWQSQGWATIQTLEGEAKAFIAHYSWKASSAGNSLGGQLGQDV